MPDVPDTGTPLFPQRIERVPRVVEHDLVPVPNGANARYVMSEDGRRWVLKREEDTGWQALLAEAISLLLGQSIGAPVARGAVYVGDSGRGWLSGLVEEVVHWSPARRDFVTNPVELGALLTLDALVVNDDRHAGNLLLTPHPDEAHVRALGIDLGNALVGFPSDFLTWPIDGPPSVRNHARGLPLAAVRDGAIAAAVVAQTLDSGVIRELVLEGCSLVQERTADDLARTLERRCRHAVQLTLKYLEALETLE